ncbi:hypothetical protein ACQ4PT_019642 [Festuca glaucescens]
MATGGDKCGRNPEACDDLYAVMGLNEDCSDADLKVAYRKLAMKWHPDRWSSSSTKQIEEAKEKFQQIQGAYSVLSDANKRLLYDMEMCEQDEGEDSLQGMGDFLDEMAHMISQTAPAMSDTKQAPKARGGDANRRRNDQKQKLSSKHDVSSEDELPSLHQHRVA